MDKAGNPICFKCSKIGYARDCPKHPYKPRVYALGISEEIETLEDLPEETDEVPEEDEEPGEANQNIVWEDEEDKYVEDPYNGEFTQEGSHMGDNLPDGDYPAQMNMMSFINESDDYSHVHLASAKQTEGILTKETFVNELIEKPIEYANIHKPQYLTKSSMPNQITDSTAPQKVLKRTPPIMDSKLRISCQAGTYPANRSADLHRTLTVEINIVGIDAFILFDSGVETDAISLDFIRACNLPLLELPNPMVLQMGTKGSHSCVYYSTNIDMCTH